MSTESSAIADDIARAEQRRVQALLDVDEAAFDELHADDYQLCNPTGTIWSKAEYLDHLTSGTLVYHRLAPLTSIDVFTADDLAVARYRCVIALHMDDNDIPEHECWHTDVYRRRADGQWRCTWSQATGIMATVHQTIR